MWIIMDMLFQLPSWFNDILGGAGISYKAFVFVIIWGTFTVALIGVYYFVMVSLRDGWELII